MKRSLSLKKETLAELSAGELALVAGGGTQLCVQDTFTCLTGVYPTLPVMSCLCDIIDVQTQ